MLHRLFLTILSICFACTSFAQQQKDSLIIDSTFADYEEIFSELDALLDSLTEPRSITLVNVSIGQRFLTYETKSAALTETRRRFIYSPSIGHYDKSGFGMSAGASLIKEGSGYNPYQFSLTGSYDYLKNKAFSTGISFTRFFTKHDLSFYNSPLQNEIYGYFTYRKPWLKPTIGISYGWGSRESYEEVEERIQNINLAQNGFTRINTNERVIDLNLYTSVRHDFYFLNALSSDYIRLTPQVSFISGSQQFGFNQTNNTYATLRRTGRNILFYTEDISFNNEFYFQPISLTAFIKAEYAKGKFYLQPQLMMDYFFPTATEHFSTAFLINVGLIF